MKQADSAGKMTFWTLDKDSCEFKLEELGSIPGVHGRRKETTPESCPVRAPCCTHHLSLGGAKAAGRLFACSGCLCPYSVWVSGSHLMLSLVQAQLQTSTPPSRTACFRTHCKPRKSPRPLRLDLPVLGSARTLLSISAVV